MLTIVDELFILFKGEEGNGLVISTKQMQPVLAGGILAELALQNRLRVCEDARLEIVDASLTGDTVLDHASQIIQASKRLRKIQYWVEYFGERQKWTIKEIQECLVAAGILCQEDEGDFRWVIPAPNFPQREANARYWLKDRLRAAVFAGEEIDLHTLTLLSLVFYGKLEKLVFTKDEQKFGRQCIHQKVVREVLSNWEAQFIEEIGHAVKAY